MLERDLLPFPLRGLAADVGGKGDGDVLLPTLFPFPFSHSLFFVRQHFLSIQWLMWNSRHKLAMVGDVTVLWEFPEVAAESCLHGGFGLVCETWRGMGKGR